MRTEYVEAVLAVVDLVPRGTAVAYGDVAELLGPGGDGPAEAGYEGEDAGVEEKV